MGDGQVLTLTVLGDILFCSYLGPVCRCVKAWVIHHAVGLWLLSELAFGPVYRSLIKMCGLLMSAYTLCPCVSLSACVFTPLSPCLESFIHPGVYVHVCACVRVCP